MAATLARPGAALSHWSAAALWEIRRTSRESMDLAVPSRSRSSRLLHCHLSVLPTDELTLVAGIPVTTVPRTIFDLAGAEPVDLVVSLIREAEYKQLHDSLSLWDLIERYPGRRGVRRVHAALERLGTSPPGRTASELEERFVRFLEHYRLPAPRLNDWISVEDGRFQVDCHWPSSRQIVELDGWQAHGTRSAFQADRRRDRALRAWGYSVTRITWLQLENEPEALAVDLRKLLGAPSPRQTIKSMV
jgi:very-short-patch-repair endonuclease